MFFIRRMSCLKSWGGIIGIIKLCSFFSVIFKDLSFDPSLTVFFFCQILHWNTRSICFSIFLDNTFAFCTVELEASLVMSSNLSIEYEYSYVFIEKVFLQHIFFTCLNYCNIFLTLCNHATTHWLKIIQSHIVTSLHGFKHVFEVISNLAVFFLFVVLFWSSSLIPLAFSSFWILVAYSEILKYVIQS